MKDDLVSLQAVDRTVAMLEALDDGEPKTLSQIARSCGLSEATVLRYLGSLREHGLVERDAQGAYRIGLRLFQLGQRALGDSDPRRIALPVMEELLERFGETVTLAVRRRDRLVVVEARTSRYSVRRGASIGEDDAWHSTGLGKAILAYLAPPVVDGLIERYGLPAYTARTLTTPDALRADLERVRKVGYALDYDESEVGLRCVAAPVFDQQGEPQFGISISGPSLRLPLRRLSEVGPVVRDAALRVSRALGFDALDGVAHGER
jgi:IclR family transcriptional regulator, acetate operon repressor